ncbi:lipopolysaccharide biosynthesis protein [Pedobacter immunditicola]|uniref:lipopolysaccharide biosynthesis protein n=1 Tax=Pedobacter immunditicola TaxID=3133440 RepID=UPI0030997C06
MLNISRKILSIFEDNSKRTASIKREIVFSFLIKIISVITGVLLIPLLIDFLDKERYGVWLTLSSIFAWFSFFDIGIGNGMRNKLAEAVSSNNKSLAKEYVSTTFAIISIIFVSIILLFQIINPFLDWQSILNVEVITASELYILTSIVFTLFLLRFIFQLTGVVYIANHMPSINNALVTLGTVLAFIIIALFYKFTDKGNLLLLGTVLTGAPLAVLIVATGVAFSGRFKYLRPSWSSVKIKHAKSLLNLGAQFFVIQVAAILLFSSANIIISHLFSPSEVVVYNTALMYYQLPIMVYGIIMTPIWSAVTDAYTKQDFDWLKSSLLKLNKLSLLFSLGIILMIIVSPYIFELWVGDRIKMPLTLSISMACFAIINVFLSPYTSFINGIGKIKFSMYMVFLTLVFYLPLAYLLSKWLDSSAGIIIATCLLNVIGLYVQPLQVKKILNGTAKGIWNA